MIRTICTHHSNTLLYTFLFVIINKLELKLVVLSMYKPLCYVLPYSLKYIYVYFLANKTDVMYHK